MAASEARRTISDHLVIDWEVVRLVQIVGDLE